MIGSTVADVLIHVDHLPSLEEDINPFGQELRLGGCCYNAARMLQLFKVKHTLFSPVGSGLFGEFVKEQLAGSGRTPVLETPEVNGCCYCIIDGQGARTFLAVHGAEYKFRKEWFDALDASAYSDVYLCGLEVEEDTGIHMVEFLQAHPHLNIWFAPSARILHVQKEKMNAILDCHPIVHLNRQEAYSWLKREGLFSGVIEDSEGILSALAKRTGNAVIMTDGARGAYLYDNGRVIYEPAIPTTAVDGTGAGDSHIGTIMALTMKGASYEEAMHIASIVSSRVVSRTGAVLSDEEFSSLLLGQD